MIHPARVRILNKGKVRPGTFVVYWMQQSQRVASNRIEKAGKK